MSSSYSEHIFINCPFDLAYKPLEEAVLFAIFDCGFVPRSAKELDDSSEIRISKIVRIIKDCKYGIHDISRTELDSQFGLPRFNMPLELGIFIGARQYGEAEQGNKAYLIVDSEPYRYQKFISDISGQDIRSHANDPLLLMRVVRNWLRSCSGRKTIPGAAHITKRFARFKSDLPDYCSRLKLDNNDLTFNDYCWLVSEWLRLESSL